MTWNADLFSPLSLARTHLIPFPVDSPHEITPGQRKKSTFQKVDHRSYFNSKECDIIIIAFPSTFSPQYCAIRGFPVTRMRSRKSKKYK
jgi:hypothetical protein